MMKQLPKGVLISLFLALFLTFSPVYAQDELLATEVSIRAEDGLSLQGFWFPVDNNRPSVILLHEMYSNHTSWTPLIYPLVQSGYNVLAIDLRGMGKTGGRMNWPAAVQDVQAWLNWLRNEAGVRGDAISIIGSSIGSNLAVVACGNDTACRTAIAISPGWSYYGIGVEQALKEQMIDRSVYVIYAERDRWPKLGVPLMQEAAAGEVVYQTFPGNTHGMKLFKFLPDPVLDEAGNVVSQDETPLIVHFILNWLASKGS
ncbi:hypothetical protein MASR2M15_15860 [Anaerolineales bacterium]